MIFGPFLKWGNDDFFNLINRLKILLFIFFIVALFVWYLNFGGPILSIIFFIFSSWIVTSSLFEFTKFISLKPKLTFKKVPLKNLSQLTAHIGIGLLIIGATGTSILKKEKIQFQDPNQLISISKFDVKFVGVNNVEGPNYISEMGEFKIYQKGEYLKSLYPERRFYNSSDQITTEAAIYSTILGDLYIAIGDKNSLNDSQSWTTRIWFNPFTLWIWIGVFLLSLGGAISLIKTLRIKN